MYSGLLNTSRLAHHFQPSERRGRRVGLGAMIAAQSSSASQGHSNQTNGM